MERMNLTAVEIKVWEAISNPGRWWWNINTNTSATASISNPEIYYSRIRFLRCYTFFGPRCTIWASEDRLSCRWARPWHYKSSYIWSLCRWGGCNISGYSHQLNLYAAAWPLQRIKLDFVASLVFLQPHSGCNLQHKGKTRSYRMNLTPSNGISVKVHHIIKTTNNQLSLSW